MPEARTRHTPPGVLLKARPLPRQLEDRIGDPMPDGIELYIHEDDVSGEPGDDRWRDSLRSRFDAITPRLTPGFSWIVEGPVWSLDGELFGLGGNRDIDRLLVERLVTLANDIGAWAVNIHAVDGSPDPLVVSDDAWNYAIERAIPFLDWYVRICQGAGLAPLIENVPPICRMRRGAFIFTPHGVEPGDLLALCNAVPGLRLTVDTSHAQLAVNALRGVPPPEGSPESVAVAGSVYRRRGEAGGPSSNTPNPVDAPARHGCRAQHRRAEARQARRGRETRQRRAAHWGHSVSQSAARCRATASAARRAR